MLGRLLCPYTFQDLEQSFQNTYTDVKIKLLKTEQKKILEILRRQIGNYEHTTSKEVSTEGIADMFVLEAHELTAQNTYWALFSIHLYK